MFIIIEGTYKHQPQQLILAQAKSRNQERITTRASEAEYEYSLRFHLTGDDSDSCHLRGA